MKQTVFVAMVVFTLAGSVQAQEPTAPPVKGLDPLTELQQKVESLTKQLAAVRAQLPQPSPEATQAKQREAFATTFKQLKAQIGPGCKTAGGRLVVTINQASGQTSVTTACQFK